MDLGTTARLVTMGDQEMIFTVQALSNGEGETKTMPAENVDSDNNLLR